MAGKQNCLTFLAFILCLPDYLTLQCKVPMNVMQIVELKFTARVTATDNSLLEYTIAFMLISD